MINLRVHKQLHHIYESTSPKSLSSSILLNADLRSRDVDYITSDWRIQLAYNVEFLKKQKKKYQVLNCSYCPKENLFINEDFTRQPETEFLATVDHIVPISKGGDKLSYDNFIEIAKGLTRIEPNQAPFLIIYREDDYWISCRTFRFKEDMELLKNNVELLDQNWKFNNNKKNLVISNSTIELGRILNNYGFDIKSHFQPTKLIKELDINQLKYFFLGLSDGDGSWYMNKKQGIYQYAIYSTYDQEWEYIENIFSKLNIKFSIQRIIRKNINSKSSCIRITNKLDVIKWGNYLYNNYNNDNIGLLRKYNKYISMF